MQILDLLDMYFDAAVVICHLQFTFIQIGSGHTVIVAVRPESIRLNERMSMMLFRLRQRR